MFAMWGTSKNYFPKIFLNYQLPFFSYYVINAKPYWAGRIKMAALVNVGTYCLPQHQNYH